MPFMIKNVVTGATEVNVRATLAIIFTLAICVGFFMQLLTPDSFIGIAGVSVGWYFAKKSEDDKKPTTP